MCSCLIPELSRILASLFRHFAPSHNFFQNLKYFSQGGIYTKCIIIMKCSRMKFSSKEKIRCWLSARKIVGGTKDNRLLFLNNVLLFLLFFLLFFKILGGKSILGEGKSHLGEDTLPCPPVAESQGDLFLLK